MLFADFSQLFEDGSISPYSQIKAGDQYGQILIHVFDDHVGRIKDGQNIAFRDVIVQYQSQQLSLLLTSEGSFSESEIEVPSINFQNNLG